MIKQRYLNPPQVARIYNRIGRLQDTQGFYERHAINDLIHAGRFEAASSVVEIGCGTGALAARLLAEKLSGNARYLGLDVSRRMITLARARTHAWSDRATVIQVDGHSRWPIDSSSADRVVAAYVLDLLSPAATLSFFNEAARILRPGGLVAVVSLARGQRGTARLVSTLWTLVWRIHPALTGGCRPVELATSRPPGWRITHTATITSFAITSQVLLLAPPAE